VFKKNKVVWRRLDLCGSAYGKVEDFCEYGNELSGSTKLGKFSVWFTLAMDSAAWSWMVSRLEYLVC
jgi:hypothetical protein